MDDRYDAGLLNNFGGGNVEWWQDYIRAELDRAHDFYSAALDRAEAERDELATVISGIEVSNGLTDNGNLWRFWSSKCKELAKKVVAAEADKAAAVEAMRERCAALIDCGGCYDYPCCNPTDCNAILAAAIRTGAKP